MKKTPYFILSLCLLAVSISTLQAQEAKGTWAKLSKVTFKKEYDDILGYEKDVPIFSKSVKALNGKEITIKGYIIPVEGYKQQNYFVFSAFPYNMCYFCGGAGPETVMEVFTPKDKSIKYTAKPITIKGKLVLNSKDVSKLMYLLDKAVIVETER